MKIYYFSSGPREKVLLKFIEMGLTVSKVFISSPDVSPKIIPTIEIAKKHSIPVVEVTKSQLSSIYQSLDSEVLCFSAGFRYIFPKDFIDHFNLILNVHGTLLPHYSGARTLNWVIENGEKYSGVTVHKIDAGIDTGPILFQERFELSSFDTGKSLYRKTLEFEPFVIEKALNLVKNKQLNFISQSYDGVPIYPNRVKEHSKVDPMKSLLDLINQIKASDPESYPAFFDYHGEPVGIKLFRLNQEDDEHKDMI